MTIAEGRALRAVVAEYLQRTRPQAFPSPSAFLRLPVALGQDDCLRIGSWIYDPAAQTLTDYARPGKMAGYDRLVHLTRQDGDWTIETVSLVEVFGPGRGMP